MIIYMIAMISYHKNNTPQHPSTLSFFGGCNSGHPHFWCVFSFQKETTAAGNLLIINQSIGVQWIGHSNQSTWEVPWLSKKKSLHFWSVWGVFYASKSSTVLYDDLFPFFWVGNSKKNIRTKRFLTPFFVYLQEGGRLFAFFFCSWVTHCNTSHRAPRYQLEDPDADQEIHVSL